MSDLFKARAPAHLNYASSMGILVSIFGVEQADFHNFRGFFLSKPISLLYQCLAEIVVLIAKICLKFERGRAIGLKEDDWLNRLIARHLCRSEAAIRRCWGEWVNNGSMQRQDGSGRPRDSSEREDRAIVITAVAAPDSMLSTIQPVTGTQVSKMTINRRLRERNLRARLTVTILTPHTRAPTIFSYESRFLLCPEYRRKHVWRRPGQRVDPGITFKHQKEPQQGVMVWGANCNDSRTPLVVIPGTLTAQLKKYLSEKKLPLRALLVMDNAPAHPPSLKDHLLDEFKFIEVRFLPPNTTPLLQPMDQQEPPIIDVIVSLGKTLGLEVNEPIIQELVEEEDQELTTNELIDLHREQHQEVKEVISSGEEEDENSLGSLPSDQIREICKMWETVQLFVAKHHPNKPAALRATDQFNDNAMSYFREILKKRQKQQSLDQFFDEIERKK
ncbi:hypothetical protein LAZ67_5004062 [Cordylochernes scorpioides]|uniref:DDE-1 domain-containing protein n=1 Tax=Cordylochernes scorpioides TaxID=51811 RepID=A0ABY6KL89_9ARAC|nr:hypothetical protein LAZ67_5004062 [Cordylochernes scorpioides]